jgi:hypothetical protein
MTPSRRSLDSLQRWMQSVIVHPGGVTAGACGNDAAAALGNSATPIDDLILRSNAMTAEERLAIYNRSYFARLLECLREEYSVLARAVGEELFNSFALGYLHQHPPTSYTLADLGKQFPEFLAASRPAEDGDWTDLVIDLARLERTVNDVFDGPGVEGEPPLRHEDLAVIPGEEWPHTRLECAPCLQFVPVEFDVNDYFTALRRGEAPDVPARKPGHIAVTRRDYRIQRYTITSFEHAVLAALHAGSPVAAAIETAAPHFNGTDDEFAIDLRQCFFKWTAAGFFRSVFPN